MNVTIRLVSECSRPPRKSTPCPESVSSAGIYLYCRSRVDGVRVAVGSPQSRHRSSTAAVALHRFGLPKACAIAAAQDTRESFRTISRLARCSLRWLDT